MKFRNLRKACGMTKDCRIEGENFQIYVDLDTGTIKAVHAYRTDRCFSSPYVILAGQTSRHITMKELQQLCEEAVMKYIENPYPLCQNAWRMNWLESLKKAD